MATITLNYNGRNKIAKAIVKMIVDSGLFRVLTDDEPNVTTKRAIKDAKEGRTYKAENLDDLVKYLNS
ncbi:MAG: hypothetical protein IK017_01565 [Paludibacteraceae bacterium]|nr:hypothetical protein [Paludibacteraceae bacterium]